MADLTSKISSSFLAAQLLFTLLLLPGMLQEAISLHIGERSGEHIADHHIGDEHLLEQRLQPAQPVDTGQTDQRAGVGDDDCSHCSRAAPQLGCASGHTRSRRAWPMRPEMISWRRLGERGSVNT